MNIQPTLDLHPELHQVFHFAPDTESSGCCCFWKSRPKKEYVVDEKGRLKKTNSATYAARIVANQRLARIIKSKFEDDPIENNRAYEMLKMRINHDIENGDKITDKRLSEIIEAVHDLKKDIGKDIQKGEEIAK